MACLQARERIGLGARRARQAWDTLSSHPFVVHTVIQHSRSLLLVSLILRQMVKHNLRQTESCFRRFTVRRKNCRLRDVVAMLRRAFYAGTHFLSPFCSVGSIYSTEVLHRAMRKAQNMEKKAATFAPSTKPVPVLKSDILQINGQA